VTLAAVGRLAAYVAILAVVFAACYAIGSALQPS
jgi:hypothetical protein